MLTFLECYIAASRLGGVVALKRFFHRFNDIDTEDPKRPYKCHLCPYAAHTRSNLKNHINAHTGERPYKCTVCGRGFTQKGNMKKHEQQHDERFTLYKAFIIRSSPATLS
ncbi:hypothetical protein TNCT_63411 [Trichonephila clavata]|uniref:C2H2-type domain-containing protein n=1 Tax=Trichonephila clavata TaxID=2740835 RepID=A0A8X6EYS1_TRICU|nr:hypothetical protein TNCT_63411 [Trichonephila clavata]